MTPELRSRIRVCVIWDVDGVIIDSAAQHLRAWRQLAEENGLPFTDEAFWATFGMRNADIIPRMFGIEGPPERMAALGDRKEALYREFLAREAAALPGAKELMATLHAAGYRQALGSSAPPANIETIVQLLGLGGWLEATVSGEEVARGKPAPDIFLRAAERLGIAPARCLVIEDAPAGVAAAHAGGMRCIAVRRAGVPDAPGLEAADLVADSLRDVDVTLVDRLLGVGPSVT
jgi:beta-phosphoglucomutase